VGGACGTTRWISVTTDLIKLKTSIYTSLTIASAYSPDKGKEEEQYQSLCDSVADLTHKTQQNSMIVIGADANAVIGKRERNTDAHVLGPNGNTCVNDRGYLLLKLMRKSTLVDTLSFHKHKLYDRWVRNFDNKSYAHDHFLIKYKGQKIKINDVRVTRVAVQSDHPAIELKMKIKTWRPNKQGRRNMNITKTKKTKTDYNFLKEHPEKQEAFDEAITRFVIEQKSSYPDLAEHIVKQYSHKQEHWLKTRLVPRKQNFIIETHRGEKWCPIWNYQEGHQLDPKKLQGTRKALKREKRKSKMRWQNKLARECKDEDFTMATKEAWKVCREIEKGFTGHLPKISPQ
jgi:ribosomal protein S17